MRTYMFTPVLPPLRSKQRTCPAPWKIPSCPLSTSSSLFNLTSVIIFPVFKLHLSKIVQYELFFCPDLFYWLYVKISDVVLWNSSSLFFISILLCDYIHSTTMDIFAVSTFWPLCLKALWTFLQVFWWTTDISF